MRRAILCLIYYIHGFIYSPDVSDESLELLYGNLNPIILQVLTDISEAGIDIIDNKLIADFLKLVLFGFVYFLWLYWHYAILNIPIRAKSMEISELVS